MAAKKKDKRKAKREKKERRFLPDATRTSRLSAAAGGIGALALGAGVYGQFIRDPQLQYAQYMVAGGALVLGAALFFADGGGHPLRVGDAGVAIERGSELTRVRWCEMKRMSFERDKLLIESEGGLLSIPIEAHRVAVSWIVKEAASRMPEVVDIKPRESDALREPRESDGTLVKIENVQIAGLECRASQRPISFERDARLCPTCAEVYHRDHVPKKCMTCGDEIAGRAYQV